MTFVVPTSAVPTRLMVSAMPAPHQTLRPKLGHSPEWSSGSDTTLTLTIPLPQPLFNLVHRIITTCFLNVYHDTGAKLRKAAQFVVYDLPDRDCAAAASNGEWAIANNGANNYKRYIDRIREILIQYSDIRTILVIEPDSLANMVTNMNVQKCANAATTYKELTIYALKQLNLPHVAMYMDAGHAGWLGWPANIQPAAELFGQLYRDAGKPASVRGLAVRKLLRPRLLEQQLLT